MTIPNHLDTTIVKAFVFVLSVATSSTLLGDEPVQTQSIVKVKSLRGESDSVCVSSRDEVWKLNMRNSHCFSDCVANQLPTQKLLDGCWTNSSFADLLAAHLADQTRPTILFLHGNRTDASWSESRGLQAYENLFQGCIQRPAIRFVIVQWKSEPECKRVVNDYLIKSRRSVALGASFNGVMTQFQGRKPVLVGYSLGGQIILAALNCPDKLSVTNDSTAPNSLAQPLEQFRVALIAAAVDDDFAKCGGRNSSAVSRVSGTLIFNNDTDLIVNASERMCSKSLGFTFDTRYFLTRDCSILGQTSVFDVASQVGKKHSVVKYTQSPTVIQQINGLIAE